MSNSVFHPTLYTPAITPAHKQLHLANNHEPGVWRMVLCTEDSIREDQVDDALDTLRTVLRGMDPESRVGVFVRVRSAEVMRRVLGLPNADKLTGFVVPKVGPEIFSDYADQLTGTSFRLMPILEAPQVVDRGFRDSLRAVLTSTNYRPMIDCVRIGANDLMGHLGIRRDTTDLTVYDTPIGGTIYDIINEFRGIAEFKVTAPVYECFAPAYDGLLRKEVQRHILNGLYGQTVIHPRHIRMIRDLYKVSVADLESARNIVDGSNAVHGLHGRMDEVTTHWKWANTIIERYNLFGDNRTSMTGVHVFADDNKKELVSQ